ncbi:hypothetical protein CK203_040751 [Vitis vinifera]|uniref:Integrase catalytic domain-containing protein n=1 Tax=Vitis vinifera TaxID=29760 RepID=A0A438HF61_VITVI|nr:hypothetical protein CK203_040751 [Vitis vinifera]
MIMRSLQPRFARHLMGFPHTDFGSLGKRPSGGQRSGDVGAISSAGMRPPRHYQTVGQTWFYYPPSPMCITERPPAPYIDPELHRPHLCRGHHVSLLSWGPGMTRITARFETCYSGFDRPGAPSSGDIHHMDLIEDDSIHMLSWDDGLPEPIVLHDSYEIDGVSLVLRTCTIQFDPRRGTIPVDSSYTLIIGCQDTFVPFTLWPEDDDSEGREIQIVTRSGRIAQPPPPAVRPFEGAASHEEVRREDDEVLRQLQSTQARISIWSLLASSSTHRDFDSSLESDQNFGPSTQTVRAYDSTKREVMGTLVIDLQIGPATFSTLFQVLRIPTSFNLLLGRPWIHRAGAIPSSLHQKVKFIHDGQTLEIEDFHRDFVAMTTSAGTSEFIAAIDHDTTFGLGFIPTEADYRTWRAAQGEEDQRFDPLEEIHSVVHTDREIELQHLFHQLQLSDGAPLLSMATPTSPDRASMLSLCFPEEITDDGQITGIVQLQPVSAFDMFGVSTIEVLRGPDSSCSRASEDDSSLFEGIVSPVEGASDLVDPPLSFDVLSGFVSRSDDIFDIDDELHGPSDRDSLIMTLSMDERVSPATGMLRLSYLDVFAWSYEDMPGLDPSIVSTTYLSYHMQTRYNQILMAPEDMEKTTFITEWVSGIEVDPDKIKAILDMPAPKTEKEIRVWNDDCQLAFEKIKEYLLSPPVLVPPTPGRPLLLYLSVSDMALGCMLAQIDDLGRNELFTTERLRHYMTEYSVHLISRLDPLRYLFDRPALTGRLMRWLVLLTEFDINEEFVAMTSLSGWCMYFDGAANQSGYGIGVLLVSPQGDHIPRSTDSGDWKTRDVKLRPYHAYLELLVARFDDLRYVLLRAQNRFADALATLASSVDIPIDFLRSGTYPEVATTKDRRALRNLATRFVICGDTLYRRSADGVCGPHMGGHMLARKIMRTGYFWLTMETDCCQFVQKCPECQIHGDLIHAPPSELHALTSPWPFSVWGIDIIGKVSPKSSSGHEFILVAIDYFTKWVEAASYARGVHFRAEVDTLLQKYGIRHHRSSAYRPQTNGAVEAANKNIKRILRKMVETSRDWLFCQSRQRWALRVALEQQISETEWAQARLISLTF